MFLATVPIGPDQVYRMTVEQISNGDWEWLAWSARATRRVRHGVQTSERDAKVAAMEAAYSLSAGNTDADELAHPKAAAAEAQ